MEDKILVWKFKNGSKAALKRIYEKYRDDLLRVASALANQRPAAEDIVHDVFISFVRNRSNFELTGSLKSYLIKCVVNRVRNLNKANNRQSFENVNEATLTESNFQRPDEWVIENEQSRILNEALSFLPYEQKEAVVMHTQVSLKFRQIAKLQDVSIKTAQSRYRYGIDKLRSLLDGKVTL